MATTYSLVSLLVGMMIVTTAVGAGRSNMLGYSDQYPLDPEDDLLDLLYGNESSDIIVGGRPGNYTRLPPIFLPQEEEEDLSDFDSHH